MDVAALVVSIVGLFVSAGAWLWAWRANQSSQRIERRFDDWAEPVSWALEPVSKNGSETRLRLTNSGPGTARATVLKATGPDMNLTGATASGALAPNESLEFTDLPLSDNAGREVAITWRDSLGEEHRQEETLPVWRSYL